MFPNHFESLANELHRDRLAAAERRRLIRELLARPEPRVSRARRAAYWLGTRMIAWGARLQGYGRLPAFRGLPAEMARPEQVYR